MSNFAFLETEFPELAEAAMKAERQALADARASCFHARFALETTIHWLFRFDQRLKRPYDRNLGAFLYEPSFRRVLPEAVFQKARVIHKMGNAAAHNPRPVGEGDALRVVQELHHVLYWVARTYSREAQPDPGEAAWSDGLVPKPVVSEPTISREELARLEAELERTSCETLEKQQKIDALDAELKTVREELAKVIAENEAKSDPHDYSEAETRKYLIDVDLRRAGWPLEKPQDREYPVTGMPNSPGKGFVDYVLWGDNGLPLGLVEAKRTTADPKNGQQQAKLYADCLEQMHGQRPVIFFTNGYETWIWDDRSYPPRRVAGFYSKDDLERLVQRRQIRKPLDVAQVNEEIAGRYYQKRAIASLGATFAAHQRKGLLVMATGTGKTRTAIALTDVLQRANWAKRVLFLADRISLVNQAANAFKMHLPDSSPVNLVTEKNKEGRVYVCTYPTMMGLIDETKGGVARFGPGHFDLVIIDEAHRSIYQKYGAIFEYFDSLLLGLTATPREEIDKNTYDLFDLEAGVPTDAYELDQAVSDGFLVPPRVEQVDLKFPREGISYDDLSQEEQAEWEGIDWGDDGDDGPPAAVNASAINQWLFNTDTVDKVLQHLMERGHTVASGDRLGKTIIFARNHDQAKFIEERFNHHYPELKGHFARVIDNQAAYPQSLIDDFSLKDKEPHIAISVDMLDTGIDVPEVVNLVFFKPVYSKIKFWQMIGRGTRLCENLFEPDKDKKDFRIFDFCFNFDFFRENPDGIEGRGGESIGSRLFKTRVELLATLQKESELEPEGKLTQSLAAGLHAEVAAMNPENFIVRMRLEPVERFQKKESWGQLTEGDVHVLERDIANLPSQIENDEIEARMFDLKVLKMQLGVANKSGVSESIRLSVIEIAALLEGKDAIPAVTEQLAYLQIVQTTEFWEGITLALLEELRLRLRGLVQFLDKKKRKIVYTDFEDEIQGVRVGEPVLVPKMTGAQYERKVKEFLKAHLDHIVIHRLRTNQPMTALDLAELERTLQEIGEDQGERLLSDLLAQSEAPSLPHFVRKLIGMDRTAAQQAFAEFLGDRSLSANQIRFVELIIDQLTHRGVMGAEALYESPFSDLDAGGPEAVFTGKEQVIEGIFSKLEATCPQVDEVG
tara:strand:- start:3780 stop:7169 length:3390 start_codon:yes stop_codon:yes gene_type:complete